MRWKSEAFERFKEFRDEAEKQLGKYIKALRSNRGGEYFLGDFIDHLSEAWILSQLIESRTPQQNGVAERRNITLLEMVRTMMSYGTLPMSFWGYALEITTHLLNLVPSKIVSKIPFELWTGQRSSMRYIHIWG
jgi:transposase InsO family protein